MRTNDVLAATVRPYLRGFARVPNELDRAVASTGFAVLRANEPRILARYLWAVVRSRSFLDHLVHYQTGAAYPAVRPIDIARFEFRLPDEQQQLRVLALIESADALSAILKKRSAAADELLDALLEVELTSK